MHFRFAAALMMALALGAASTPGAGAAQTFASLKYPPNKPGASFIAPAKVLAKLQPPFSAPTIKLIRFGALEPVASGGMKLYTVSDDRMVYEIRSVFNTPYSYRGMEWSSGVRYVIIDAETGDSLMGGITGNQTKTRKLPTPPPTPAAP